MTAPVDSLAVRDLVVQLGGPSRVARAIGVSPEAVCNWKLRGSVPKSRELQVWQLAQQARLAWKPPGAEKLVLAPSASLANAGLTTREEMVTAASPTQAAA